MDWRPLRRPVTGQEIPRSNATQISCPSNHAEIPKSTDYSNAVVIFVIIFITLLMGCLVYYS